MCVFKTAAYTFLFFYVALRFLFSLLKEAWKCRAHSVADGKHCSSSRVDSYKAISVALEMQPPTLMEFHCSVIAPHCSEIGSIWLSGYSISPTFTTCLTSGGRGGQAANHAGDISKGQSNTAFATIIHSLYSLEALLSWQKLAEEHH